MPYLIFQRKVGTGNQGTGIGIIGGGITTGPVLTSATQRWTMSNNTTAASTALSGGRQEVGAISDGTQAHFGFGNQDFNYNSSSGTEYMDKYVYSTEARTQPTANLNGSIRQGPASFNNPTYGWFVGGVNSGVEYINLNLRIQHGTSSQINSAQLAVAKGEMAGLSNATHGFVFGGSNPTALNVIQKYTMPSGTWGSVTATLSVGRYIFSGDGNGTYGILPGGYTGAAATTLNEKFTFGTEAISTTTALSVARLGANVMGNKTIAVIAGVNAANGASEKFYFSTEALSPTTTLSPPLYRGGATCNQNGGLL